MPSKVRGGTLVNYAHTPVKERSPFLGAAAGILVGAAFGLVGYLLATIPASRNLGSAVFVLVPFSAGIAISFTVRGKGSVTAAALISTLVSLIFLVAIGREGLLCALMAFPFVFLTLLAGIVIGLGLGFLLHALLGSAKAPRSTTLLLLPLLIIGGHQL
jgi:F0F1-type ATP synthase assembly protein I